MVSNQIVAPQYMEWKCKKEDDVPSDVCNVYTLQFCSGIRESAKSENGRRGRRYVAVVGGGSITGPKSGQDTSAGREASH